MADHISNYRVAYINEGDISTYPFAKCEEAKRIVYKF